LTTAPLYIGKLALLSKNFLKGISSGALDPSSRTWPGLAELNILRLVGMTWSTSDLSHPVAAAALLVIGQYLSPQTRIRSLEDIASGLFLCTLVAQYEERSKRYVPEVMGFLEQTIGILLPTTFRNRASIANSNNSGTKTKSSRVIPGSFSTPDWGTDHVKGLKLRTNIELIPSTTVNLPESLRVVPRTPAVKGSKKSGAVQVEQIEITQKKVDLIATTFKVLESFVEMYVTLEAFVEIIKPVEEILTGVITTNLPESIKVNDCFFCSFLPCEFKLTLPRRLMMNRPR
jgi:nucleolar protein 14